MNRIATRTTVHSRKRLDHFCRLFLILFSIAVGSALAADISALPQGKPGVDGRSSTVQRVPFANGRFTLEHGDIVAFLGGADVAASQHTGHLEALLAARFHGLGVHFRNFGWEGDTVYAQPRDVGFPPLKAHLKRAGASVIVLQFGRTEAMGGL